MKYVLYRTAKKTPTPGWGSEFLLPTIPVIFHLSMSHSEDGFFFLAFRV